ncbi:MAG: Gfo/Idh/MocA family oxidoreductase, partial [Kiritimatiellae bacterium]|nr:Gfo/Idh/MocA family oxidoreductase [Kiritimatiellia bacterium]
MKASRRGFIKGVAGAAAFAGFGGCCGIGRAGNGKIRLACVGAWGKGFSDWMPMVQSGMAELVAICDADSDVLGLIANDKGFKALGVDLAKIPFYSDYRKLLDDAKKLDIQAMTISTPDHVHAPVAIGAMKQGIHVYVQKPLVRTLWELDYFGKTAKDNGVIVQMGNQGSSLNSMRRCTDILQSGIIGDVK